MAGAAGVELYIGAGLDVSEQDYHGCSDFYKYGGIAANFMMKHVPYPIMERDDNFASNALSLKKEDDV